MKYNEGDKVRVKSKEWYNNNKDEYGNVHLISKYGWMFTERDSKFCGKVVTILLKGTTSYAIVEDSCEGFWTDEMFECKMEEKTKSHNNMCKQLIDEMNPNVEVNVKTKPKPKYKIGDIVYLRFSDRPMKIIDRCYDEYWRYKIEGLEDNEYWYYEKDFKNIGE